MYVYTGSVIPCHQCTVIIFPIVLPAQVAIKNPVVINVKFIEQFKVQNPQQIPVTVYDYYNPGTTHGSIILVRIYPCNAHVMAAKLQINITC